MLRVLPEKWEPVMAKPRKLTGPIRSTRKQKFRAVLRFHLNLNGSRARSRQRRRSNKCEHALVALSGVHPHDAPVVFVGKQIDRAVRPLPEVTDPLADVVSNDFT